MSVYLRSPRVDIALLSIALTCTAGTVHAQTAATGSAQTYPTKTVRVIFPFPPGGPTDVLGRAVAQKLSAQLGQQFIAATLPGAGGPHCHVLASKVPPDGYPLESDTPSIQPSPSFFVQPP